MDQTTSSTALPLTTIRFPEIKLLTRDAHKLRGYFGNLFKEHSPLLHNHYENGKFRYRYPTIQYKVLNGTPTLVGVGEGAELLPQLFLKIKTIEIEGREYVVNTKNIDHRKTEIGLSGQLEQYRFETLWMALNQENYQKYQALEKTGKQKMLDSILVGHILGFFSNMRLRLGENERIMAKVDVREKTAKFKDQKMMAFEGSFVANALLPDLIGLGKATSRGFGTLKKT